MNERARGEGAHEEHGRDDRSDPARLRCPYCHDGLPARDDHERVTCAACGAEHHADCVLEGQGCSATGCAARDVIVGAEVVSLLELAQLVRDPARLARLARRRTWPALARLLVAAGVVAAVVVAAMLAAGGQLHAAPVIVVGVIACAALHRLIVEPPRRNRRDPQQEQRLLGELGVVVPDATAPLVDLVRRGGAPAPARAHGDATAPERCTACDQPVTDEDADEEAAWFCHHCGASLR